MDEDPQDYSDSSSCCQTAVTRHLHPEEQNDLQLDSESDTSGIYFPPQNGKEDYISVDVENDFADIEDNIHSFSESSIDIEQIINPISNDSKPIRSPYLLRSRSCSPVKCISSVEISPINTLDNNNFPKINMGLKSSKRSISTQRRVAKENSLPPVRESDEPCSSKSLEDDNKVHNADEDQNDLIGYSGDNMKQDDQEIVEKNVKNGPLVLNINLNLNCEKDKPLVLNISPQYHGSNSTEDIKLQYNMPTTNQNPIEDIDKTVVIGSETNEKGSQNDKIGSQTEEMACQTEEMACQTEEMASHTDDMASQTDEKSIPFNTVIGPEEKMDKTTEKKIIAPGPSNKPTNKEKKGTGIKSQPRARVAKDGNKSQTKNDNHKARERKKAGPKRPRNRNYQPPRNANCNMLLKECRHYSSSSSEECCCSDSTSSSSSCSCSNCCTSSSCDCGNCDN